MSIERKLNKVIHIRGPRDSAYQTAVYILSRQPILGLDLEGHRLGTGGTTSLIQIASPSPKDSTRYNVYLFDVIDVNGEPRSGIEPGAKSDPPSSKPDPSSSNALVSSSRAADASGGDRVGGALRDLLTGRINGSLRSGPVLVIHDARRDAEALSELGVDLRRAPIVDTVVADLCLARAQSYVRALRSADDAPEQLWARPPCAAKVVGMGVPPRYVVGFARLLERHAGIVAHNYKEDGHSSMAEGHGELWLRRPLDSTLQEYAALDAALAIPLWSSMCASLGAPMALAAQRASTAWIREWLAHGASEFSGGAELPTRLVEIIDAEVIAIHAAGFLGTVSSKACNTATSHASKALVAKSSSSATANNAVLRFVDKVRRDIDLACMELRKGIKRECWMWWIFPVHISVARSSPNSQKYAIKSFEEAVDFLSNDFLRDSILRAAEAALTHSRYKSADDIFGVTDAKKLHQCATLFARAATDPNVFDDILYAFFDNKPCKKTLEALKKTMPSSMDGQQIKI